MLLVDSYTLAKHFVDGDLTKTQFMSLNASLARIEELKNSDNLLTKCVGLMRCSAGLLRYSIKCHIKTVWRAIKYSIFACAVLSLFTVYRVDLDDLKYMVDSGVEPGELVALVMEGSPEKLPADIRQAAEYLSTSPQWKRQHIRQFKTMWDSVADNKKPAIQKTTWFRTFHLLALIKEAERKKLARYSDNVAITNVKEIRSLVNALS